VLRKSVKLKYVDFLPGFWDSKSNAGDESTVENFFITKAIRKNYDIIYSDTPDFLLCLDNYGWRAEFAKYDCVKIFITIENFHPNFNAYDYAIAMVNNYEEGRRFLKLNPVLMLERRRPIYNAIFCRDKFTADDLNEKSGFCSRVVTGTAGNPIREEFFHKLSEYKKVDSGGGYLNNVGGRVVDKFKFDKQHKFSLAIENSTEYTTEKLYEAFGAHTIPIYWGNPEISKEFNTRAFVNFYDYGTIDKVVDRVKEIDNNDELYLQMMREPAFINPKTYEQLQKGLEDFLINIFETPLEESRRDRALALRRYAKVEAYGRRIYAWEIRFKARFYWLYKFFNKFSIIQKIKNFIFLDNVFKGQ
jgi:hypothetical protein